MVLLPLQQYYSLQVAADLIINQVCDFIMLSQGKAVLYFLLLLWRAARNDSNSNNSITAVRSSSTRAGIGR